MNLILPFSLFILASCSLTRPVAEVNQPTDETELMKNQEEQNWDFCQCVVALDSITFAIESDKLTIEQTDKLMQRWEFVDQTCKEFTTFDNSTPQSRSKHEKRVRKCLEEN